LGTLSVEWPPELVNEQTAAMHLGISPAALLKRREAGTAPPHTKCPCGCRRYLYDVRRLQERNGDSRPQ
jgi:hypothetical protein